MDTQGVRFFTQEVALEDINHCEMATSARSRYVEHVATLSLSEGVREVAELHLVDDGLLSRLTQSDDPATLELTLRCGWTEPGYFDLRLAYRSPQISDDDLTTLTIIAENARSSSRYGMTDAWVHEFDVLPDGRLQHSIGFHWPTGMKEVDIVCEGVDVEQIPRESRDLPPYEDRFRVGRFEASSAGHS